MSSNSRAHRNINSYYGHKVGFWQSLSLLLNAGLMVYAHVGLSGAIFTNQDPSSTSTTGTPPPPTVNGTGSCNAEDIALWTELDGEATRPTHSTFCSREYRSDNGALCLSNPNCIATCFESVYNYTPSCSACLAAIPLCGVGDGCTFVCAADSLGKECQECNTDCVVQMFACSGLPKNITAAPAASETEEGVRRFLNGSASENDSNVCNDYDLGNIPLWYRAYDLTFVGSVNDAWNGDAQLLAVIVVFFSGFWPYAKNVILLIVWYLPMSIEWQTWTILWLSRLSKYTLVDVFAVVVVLVGVQLQLDVGGTEAIIRAEPRFGILAFFVATLWEFLQIEIVKAMHEDKVLQLHAGTKKAESNDYAANSNGDDDEEEPNNDDAANSNGIDGDDDEAEEPNNANEEKGPPRVYFDQLAIPTVMWLVSVGLYIGGATMQIVHFTSKDLTATEACNQSYNLITLANAITNELGLIDNSVAWQTWVLYIVYLLLNLVFPILTHLLQFWSILQLKKYQSAAVDSQLLVKLQKVSLWTSAIWCFACIEVLLIGVFAVEFKFAELVARLAGDSNAVFLDITSGLGAGFYLLIAYSAIAGFLQFTLRMIHSMPSRQSTATSGRLSILSLEWPSALN